MRKTIQPPQHTNGLLTPTGQQEGVKQREHTGVNGTTHSPTRNHSLQKVNQFPGLLFLSEEEIETIASLLHLESRRVHSVFENQLLKIEERLLVRCLEVGGRRGDV